MKNRPYILLTPGPLTTSDTVREAMLRDWCTWDEDYNSLVQDLRARLLAIAGGDTAGYTSVLMQGSGSFVVESVIGSVIPRDGKLLVVSNGAYGDRMETMARMLGIDLLTYRTADTQVPDPQKIRNLLADDPAVTHVAAVHVETTTGILNPVAGIASAAKEAGKVLIIDSMSGFGGVSMDVPALKADFVVSSANKCIQGTPGFGFVIARTSELEKSKGRARSHALDLYDQWHSMEKGRGKWRFTSPTHIVRAFYQALLELEQEGGVAAREKRYRENHRILKEGMAALGFTTVIPEPLQSHIITSFYPPQAAGYDFKRFYQNLKDRGFVIYPGKLTEAETFRIGNIGDIFPDDMRRLLVAVEASMYWNSRSSKQEEA
ncbi:MAG: 2-aminoethylphosphonate--pyruvate transaminase [Tannerella sp.]|jgi:2-aminoethylphosphonate-pyruvate transaminase|nr:2-aminoethylphosphonate--pyruvate transaminase [Tannerella sp.]